MTRYVARVTVMLKPLVNDPPGLAVRDGLHALGFEGVETVRVGKRLEVTLAAPDSDQATGRVHAMCEQLLSNPVIEEFHIEVTVVTPESSDASLPA